MLITGTFKDATGAARASCPIHFTPTDRPASVDGDLVTAVAVQGTTNSSGELSITLQAGGYLVQVDRSTKDRFYIAVPDGTGPIDISELIVTEPIYIPAEDSGVRVLAGYLQLLNPTTGLWHTLSVSGAAGLEQLQLAPGVAASEAQVSLITYVPDASSYVRVNAGFLQLRNPDTDLWHNLWPAGAVGVEQLELSPGT